VTDAEKLVACLREIGFEASIRPVDYIEDFRGLAPPKAILFDADRKLGGVQSEYDGWVSSVCAEALASAAQAAEPDGVSRCTIRQDGLHPAGKSSDHRLVGSGLL